WDQIEGNFIGTDALGRIALGNTLDGVAIEGGASNAIGGTTPAARNVISGNGEFGVQILDQGSNFNIVEGNFIGTTASGTAALGNVSDGVFLTTGATDNMIGGTAAGARNV